VTDPIRETSTGAPKPEVQPESPFANLAQFKPKAPETPAVDAKKMQEVSNQVADQNGFHSREARPAAPTKAKRPRFGSTEPRVQLNIKATQAESDRFYQMAKERNIRVMGDLLSMALDALEAAERKKK
jgi:hypothetical protein